MQRPRWQWTLARDASQQWTPPPVVDVELTEREAAHLRMIFCQPTIDERTAVRFLRCCLKKQILLVTGTNFRVPNSILFLRLLPLCITYPFLAADGRTVYHRPPAERTPEALAALLAQLPPPIEFSWPTFRLMTKMPPPCGEYFHTRVTAQPIGWDTVRLAVRCERNLYRPFVVTLHWRFPEDEP